MTPSQLAYLKQLMTRPRFSTELTDEDEDPKTGQFQVPSLNMSQRGPISVTPTQSAAVQTLPRELSSESLSSAQELRKGSPEVATVNQNPLYLQLMQKLNAMDQPEPEPKGFVNKLSKALEFSGRYGWMDPAKAQTLEQNRLQNIAEDRRAKQAFLITRLKAIEDEDFRNRQLVETGRARSAQEANVASLEASRLATEKHQREIERLAAQPKFGSSPLGIYNQSTGSLVTPGQNLSQAEVSDRDILGAYADTLKKPVSQLTAGERVKARQEFERQGIEARAKTNLSVYGPMQYPTIDSISGEVRWTPRSGSAGALAPRGEISNAAQEQIGGAKTEIELIDQILPQIRSEAATLGPLAGRVKLAEVDRLGGMGATPDQIRLAANLQRLLTSESFANGGKQLTITEYTQFKKLIPQLSDTFDQAIIRAQQARDFLKSKARNRLESLPVNAYEQLPKALRDFFISTETNALDDALDKYFGPPK